MKLAIAVLAHNEQDEIAGTLESLFRQSVFFGPALVTEISVYVIANGCTDQTVSVSERTLAQLRTERSVFWKVVCLQKAGKANAWNAFVHDLLCADVDYAAIMDADVRFGEVGTIASCLKLLEGSPQVQIATPRLVKRFDERRSGRIGGLLVRAFAGTADSTSHAIAGAFYCARAGTLRNVVMPLNIIVEDGFLRAMTLTSALTEPEQLERIQSPCEATVQYVPYTRLRDIFRYQVRQAKGSAIDHFIFDELNRLPRSFQERMSEVRRRNEANPDWVTEMIRRVASDAKNMIPRGYVLRRLEILRVSTGVQKIKCLLLSPALLYDFVVAHVADGELRSRVVQTHWDRIRD
jgi:glycosyltransferase involved in cell wall biosynthesis